MSHNRESHDPKRAGDPAEGRVELVIDDQEATAGPSDPEAAAGPSDPQATVGISNPEATAGTSDPEVLFAQAIRLAEALVFSSAAPVPPRALSQLLPTELDADAVLGALRARYAGRGVELVEAAGGVQFRTALDLAPRLRKVIDAPRRLPRVAMETLAIVAYHQPVTRPEIEDIRGASLSQQTLDALLEANLITPMGRRESPGRPTLWGTTPQFLTQFGLNDIRDLPRRDDLLVEPPQSPSSVREDASAEDEAAMAGDGDADDPALEADEGPASPTDPDDATTDPGDDSDGNVASLGIDSYDNEALPGIDESEASLSAAGNRDAIAATDDVDEDAAAATAKDDGQVSDVIKDEHAASPAAVREGGASDAGGGADVNAARIGADGSSIQGDAPGAAPPAAVAPPVRADASHLRTSDRDGHVRNRPAGSRLGGAPRPNSGVSAHRDNERYAAGRSNESGEQG